MKPIEKPWQELRDARNYVERMKVSSTFDSYERDFKNSLHCLERAWNKSVAHLGRSPKYQGWTRRGQVEKLRRQDSLLSYLVNARGADEHTVEDITSRSGGGVGISPAEGGSMHIINLVVDGHGSMSLETDRPITVTFFPNRVVLQPVVNRGREYPVPKSHLGTALDSSDPVELVLIGIGFYENYLREAEIHFIK